MAMARHSHVAAPLLLAVFIALILYVSLYPFRFSADAPPVLETLRQLDWARASRGDMFNNLLLYLPLGFCLALLVEPRFGRAVALVAAVVVGGMLSLAMEIAQASIAIRVPSLTDLSLNATGSLAGAAAGSAWHALGARMTPRANPRSHSAAVAAAVLVLWLIARLWPMVPDASLRQLKRAVRPLLTPQLAWTELVAFFVGWLVVAQAVLHFARRDRSGDALLVAIAVVLVGRTFTAGATLEFAELVALALLLPALVLLSRLEDRTRSAVVALVLVAWLAGVALSPMLDGAARAALDLPSLRELFARDAPPPAQLAGKAFSYVALAWLLASAGLYPHVAAGFTVLLVLALAMLHAGAAAPAYGWADLLIATVASVAVVRWMPRK
jgi:glycopeptide antibiotics resistance protein